MKNFMAVIPNVTMKGRVLMNGRGTFAFLLGAFFVVFASDQAVAEGNFRAVLSGDEEVPPVETRARGQAKFNLSEDGDGLNFRLIVANIESVTQAHIHVAPSGQNGSVVASYSDLCPRA